MKLVKSPTLVLALILTVLIGYFEPANAAKTQIKGSGATASYVALNSTTALCPFWPNPISPTASLTAIGLYDLTGGTIQSVGGGKVYGVSVLATGQSFPLSVVENNAYFEPSVYSSLTGTTLSLPSLPDGNYVLTITDAASHVYTTKLTITSK